MIKDYSKVNVTLKNKIASLQKEIVSKNELINRYKLKYKNYKHLVEELKNKHIGGESLIRKDKDKIKEREINEIKVKARESLGLIYTGTDMNSKYI